MNAAPSTVVLPAPPPDLGASLRAIIAGLCAAIGRNLFRNPIHTLQLLLVWRYLNQASALIVALLEKIAAGEFRPLPAPTTPQVQPHPRAATPRPSAPSLPRASRSRPTTREDTSGPALPDAAPPSPIASSATSGVRQTSPPSRPPTSAIRAPPPPRAAGPTRHRQAPDRRRRLASSSIPPIIARRPAIFQRNLNLSSPTNAAERHVEQRRSLRKGAGGAD